jgi:hypothetical protein
MRIGHEIQPMPPLTKGRTAMKFRQRVAWNRGWLVGCGATTAVLMAAVTPVWSKTCKAAAAEVGLYTERDLTGSCVVKGIGEYPVITLEGQDEHSRNLPSFASIELGGRVEVLACSEYKLTGTCTVISASSKTLPNIKTGSVKSVVVRVSGRPARCTPDATKVAVWDYQRFFGDCQVFNPGAYPYSIRPLQAGSLEVGAEARAKLCTGANFESPCREFRPSSYESWSYESGGRQVRGIEVRPDSVSLACQPGDFQVSLYEYANYAGRCRKFTNDDQARREFSPDETWGWAGHKLHSLWVGDDVHARLCWEPEQGRTQCLSFHSETPEGLPEFDLDHPPTLTVLLDDPPEEEEEEEPREEDPEAEEERSRTVRLAANVPFQGFPWWTARFPSIGGSDAVLTRVANPRNSVWLGFLKPGRGSDECGDPDAYVLLLPGDTMTDGQMEEAFGAESPELPITFVACSGAIAEVGPIGELRFPALNLSISYVEPR